MTTLPGQPPPSPSLDHALRLLAAGRPDEAEAVLKSTAVAVKALHGSGSHPLALAYADIARLHAAAGDYARAADAFRHICDYPMPDAAADRADRLAFMFGFGGCAAAAGRPDEAERLFRQCVAFARSLHGPTTPAFAVAVEPLAGLLLGQGKAAEAVKLLDEAYDILWRHGDKQIVAVIPLRAEALKAAGRGDNPFADLADLPPDLGTAAVARVIRRAGQSDPVRHRKVLADLQAFAEKKFGAEHPTAADVYAAVVRHETGLGPRADAGARAKAARAAVWAFAARQLPAGLLADLSVEFEPDGGLHLEPQLAREATPAEVEMVERVMTRAVEDLYTRPVPKPAF